MRFPCANGLVVLRMRNLEGTLPVMLLYRCDFRCFARHQGDGVSCLFRPPWVPCRVPCSVPKTTLRSYDACDVSDVRSNFATAKISNDRSRRHWRRSRPMIFSARGKHPMKPPKTTATTTEETVRILRWVVKRGHKEKFDPVQELGDYFRSGVTLSRPRIAEGRAFWRK